MKRSRASPPSAVSSRSESWSSPPVGRIAAVLCRPHRGAALFATAPPRGRASPRTRSVSVESIVSRVGAPAPFWGRLSSSAISSLGGIHPRLSDGEGTSGMGRTAHLGAPVPSHGFERVPVPLEQWKPWMRPRLAAATVGIVAPPSRACRGRGVEERDSAAARRRAPRAKGEPGSAGGRWSSTLAPEETVFAQNADLVLRPASNEKLATTYAALTALGPSFRIETDVLGDGRQSGATWLGDLVLKGYSAIPALDASQAPSLSPIRWRPPGIRHVSGRIVGDESWFDARRTGAGWKCELLPPRVARSVGTHRQSRVLTRRATRRRVRHWRRRSSSASTC